MTIGMDLTSLQGPNRMRGIGYTLINFINNLPEDIKHKHAFVFYLYPERRDEALQLLNLENTNYEVRDMGHLRKINKHLPGKAQLIITALNQMIQMRDLRRGDSRIKNLGGVELFLQTDQNVPLPRSHSVKKVMIIYDLIPYVLEWDYLWNYKTARERGFKRRGALLSKIKRSSYLRKIRLNCKRADILLAISEQTKRDFIKHLNTPESKIHTTLLGITDSSNQLAPAAPTHRYFKTSWGYLKFPFTLPNNVPYVLWVGGADRRRKLQDLVTAFNHLRAQGHNLKLVLTGDSMQGPENIGTLEIQLALKNCSYLDDVIFLGFVGDAEREWLYIHALAYVFPSIYEGFGLPVLEAFVYGTPVISYDNAASKEVGGDLPIFVSDAKGIQKAIQDLLENPEAEVKTEKYKHRMQSHAKEFTWTHTAKRIFDAIS